MNTHESHGQLGEPRGHGPDHVPGHHEHEGKEQKLTVIYNGVTERIDFKFEETLGVLRQRAVDAYGNIPQPHTVSLFSETGVEFGPDRDQETIRHAGIEKNDKLLLRPSKVRGGLE